MKRILLLEDDLVTAKIVLKTFESEFTVVHCSSIKNAELELATSHIDLCLLDRKLPDGDGIEICKKLRSENLTSQTPVIFISSCDSENDRVFGFYLGADDYVTKPFSILELKARVAARLKNHKHVLDTPDLVVDMDSHTVRLKDHVLSNGIELDLQLTPTEFKLLAFLIQNKNKVHSRENLIRKIWGGALNITDRVVDIHISHLRKKLSHTSLEFESFRGEGYKLVA